MNKIIEFLSDPKTFTAVINNLNVEVVTTESLPVSYKAIINIQASNIKFDLVGATFQDIVDPNTKKTTKVIIKEADNTIVTPEKIEINGDTYIVLSGRLIDENPTIEPFYQIEIKKI